MEVPLIEGVLKDMPGVKKVCCSYPALGGAATLLAIVPGFACRWIWQSPYNLSNNALVSASDLPFDSVSPSYVGGCGNHFPSAFL